MHFKSPSPHVSVFHLFCPRPEGRGPIDSSGEKGPIGHGNGERETAAWTRVALRAVCISSHVELGEALPHQSGGPQPADGAVHLHGGVGELLMRREMNNRFYREGGYVIIFTSSFEFGGNLHRLPALPTAERQHQAVGGGGGGGTWTYQIVSFKRFHGRQGFLQLLVRALQTADCGRDGGKSSSFTVVSAEILRYVPI